MPEGPEIQIARDELAAVLTGRKIRQLTFAFEALKHFEALLQGVKILAVEARGKAMLITLANGYTVYSHNQLYGRWMITPYKDYPKTNRQLRLQIHVKDHSALLYSASAIAVLNADELAAHPYLSRLGMALLDPATTVEQVQTRLAEKKFARRCLMNLLQDQRFLSGLGNYLCCEILHVCGVHPKQRLCDLTAKQQASLAATILMLVHQSYKTRGITNKLSRAMQLSEQGVAFEDYRFHVYRRDGLPCYRCGALIVKEKYCGRMGYICPACQRG